MKTKFSDRWNQEVELVVVAYASLSDANSRSWATTIAKITGISEHRVRYLVAKDNRLSAIRQMSCRKKVESEAIRLGPSVAMLESILDACDQINNAVLSHAQGTPDNAIVMSQIANLAQRIISKANCVRQSARVRTVQGVTQ